MIRMVRTNQTVRQALRDAEPEFVIRLARWMGCLPRRRKHENDEDYACRVRGAIQIQLASTRGVRT